MPTLRDQPFSRLSDFLSTQKQDYDSVMETVNHTEVISSLRVTTQLHHLKYDGNGVPQVERLAELLYSKIVDYCISTLHRPEKWTPADAARLVKQARMLFIHPPDSSDSPDTTGEAGEMLMYFLVEAILGAPQVVCKTEFKTNHRDEVKGSDGIHMKWNENDELVEVIFCEAKIIGEVGTAMTRAFASIEAFYASDMRRHEFHLATKFFKYSNADVRQAVEQLLRSGAPDENTRVKHACLIGYNWKDYPVIGKCDARLLTEMIRKEYAEDAKRLHSLLQERVDKCTRPELILDVFFLPFPDIQEFRSAFNKALN